MIPKPILEFNLTAHQSRIDVTCGSCLVATIDLVGSVVNSVLHFIYRPDHNTKLFYDYETQEDNLEMAKQYIVHSFSDYVAGLELQNASDA